VRRANDLIKCLVCDRGLYDQRCVSLHLALTKDEAHASWRLNHGLPENYTTTSEAIETTRKILEILQEYTQIEVPELDYEKDLKSFIETLGKMEITPGMEMVDIITSYQVHFHKLYQEALLVLINSCFSLYDTYKNIIENGGKLFDEWDVDISEDFLSTMVKHYMKFDDFNQLLKIHQERSRRVR